MDIMRVTARWTGFPGGPGYSNFHFAGGGGLISDAGQVAARVRNAFGSLPLRLPSSVRIEVQPTVEIIDSDTGALIGFQEIDAPTPLQGAGTGGYAGPTGGVINWRTNDVRNGRRIRGRTFIVPLVSGAFEADGTLSGAARTELGEFAQELVGGDLDSEFGVWSRPINGSGGVFATVTNYSVPDMAAVMRSRRD